MMYVYKFMYIAYFVIYEVNTVSTWLSCYLLFENNLIFTMLEVCSS